MKLQIRIDNVRNETQIREYAREVAIAFENYPVMMRAFPSDRFDCAVHDLPLWLMLCEV